MVRIAVLWSGLPDYATRCIRALIEDLDGEVEVVATRPAVPIEGMERSLGKRVHWIDGGRSPLHWSDLALATPEALLLGGFYLPAFVSLAEEARRAGGKVILASDNNWVGSLCQRTVDPLRYRLLLRRRVDGVMTTGASGVRYNRAMGFPADRIVPGIYGADPDLFNGGAPLPERRRTFLFVGQFIPRKNMLGTASAFARMAADWPGWNLEICGTGAQRDEIPRHPAINVRDFVQPAKVAELMRQARCLVLPSLEEHWGVVVHEAALSGCALLLTDVIGAAPDFARAANSVLVPARDTAAIERAMREIAAWDADRWAAAEAASRTLAAGFGPHRFSREFRDLASRLLAS